MNGIKLNMIEEFENYVGKKMQRLHPQNSECVQHVWDGLDAARESHPSEKTDVH